MTNAKDSTILIIEHNLKNLELLTDFINRLGYRSVPANDLQAIIIDPETISDVDLALVDISGYGAEIWSVCELIRSKDIHLLIVSQKQGNEITNESLRYGASGLLIKPLVMKELAIFLDSMLHGK